MSGKRYAKATLAIADRRMEWSWSMIEAIRVQSGLGALVAFLLDVLDTARAAAVRGESNVARTGSHDGSGRNEDDTRDQASAPRIKVTASD